MSVEELVKELRQVAAFPRPIHKAPFLMEQAADKLEELAAENEQQFQMLANQAQTIKVLQAALATAKRENEALREALKLAEFMLTKDSLCQSERLEEGLTVIRRARNVGGKDAE